MGSNVCHRDQGSLMPKLADFDLTLLQVYNTARCRMPCGAKPFTALEVLLDGKYKVRAADIGASVLS